MKRRARRAAVGLSAFFLLGTVYGPVQAQTETHERFVVERDADVPDLPFADNPDPTVCGIPQPYGSDNQAWLTGYYEDELLQPEVLLYDSHSRRSITGRAPSGSEVEVILSQTNPVLNYYLVRTVGLDETQEGWIPAPFLSFDEPGSGP